MLRFRFQGYGVGREDDGLSWELVRGRARVSFSLPVKGMYLGSPEKQNRYGCVLCVCIYIYKCMCICMCELLYVCIYIRTYIYIHIFVNMCI